MSRCCSITSAVVTFIIPIIPRPELENRKLPAAVYFAADCFYHFCQRITMGLFRKRDVAVFILVSIALYLSYFDSPGLKYTIDPAWFIDQRETSNTNTVDYKAVPPIITDLEGDGINEVILITSDFMLKVLL